MGHLGPTARCPPGDTDPGSLRTRRTSVSESTMSERDWEFDQTDGPPKVSREEEIVHELGRLLEGCDDPEQIEKSFIESVGRLTAARSVQWIREPVQPSGAGAGDGRLEILLSTGSVTRGRLLVLPSADGGGTWSPATLKRL